ncbi:HET-domain-containing protein [Trametes versicolor FP-101664 SS1]|uniref:HET-domain-containing protein n=1 Tax=Trametes versicolor (strain FP-101664) TaxID=717944 RepID=UPI00046245D1|nr:HET-domain-containing protein [Trametes versicolor FP-101664 SS1]EIW52293.1 HET-domain-containing protein [Trametes versicolor FP-101664 SS1]
MSGGLRYLGAEVHASALSLLLDVNPWSSDFNANFDQFSVTRLSDFRPLCQHLAFFKQHTSLTFTRLPHVEPAWAPLSPVYSVFLSTILKEARYHPGRHLSVEPVGKAPSQYISSFSRNATGASTGCLWCRFILAVVLEGRDSVDPTWSGATFGVIVESDRITPRDCAPRKMRELMVSIDSELYFSGYVHTASDDPAAPYFAAESPILDVKSPRALALAKRCIDKCVEGHERCAALSVSPDALLPTRLIDCSDPDHPRLVSSPGERGRYLALSYVWGEDQPFKTTVSNLSAYEQGIDPARLPATIRDAIHVTHALGFHFWVDALCIVQDSDANKRHEIGRMHLIYRFAYMTIIAASASKVSEGFLQRRQASAYSTSRIFPRDITLPFLCPVSAEDSVAPPQVGEIHITPTFTHVEGKLEGPSHDWEPISGRGWCMQEYFMSPRALVFTSQTIQYKCQTHTRNIGRAFHSWYGERRLADVLLRPDPPHVVHNSKDWVAAHGSWLHVVEDYSRRAVSVPSDKLVACGALAAVFQRALRSDYLAGLWRATLLRDLMWYTPDGARRPRPAVYRAPSWSWAAVDGQVSTMAEENLSPSLDGLVVAEVVRCEVAPVDAALPLGQVNDGSLVLCAALVPCGSPADARYRDDRILLRYADLDDEDELECLARIYIDTGGDLDVRRTWAVPLTRALGHVRGLVLAEAHSEGSSKTKSSKVYRRVGFFSREGNSQGDLDLGQLLPDGRLPIVEVEIV